MTNVAEKAVDQDEIVFVKCSGITTPLGFGLTPQGFPPSHVDFHPDKATAMKRHQAEYLISQDATRFEIVEGPKQEQTSGSSTQTSTKKIKAHKTGGAKKKK